MKKLYILGVVAALAIGGCQQETKEDVDRGMESASDATKDAMEGASDAVGDATAATVLTPRLKAAITADSELNDDRNLINVESTDESVTLEGHVYSQELKDKAEKIVRDEMKEAEANQTLINNLEVRTPSGT